MMSIHNEITCNENFVCCADADQNLMARMRTYMRNYFADYRIKKNLRKKQRLNRASFQAILHLNDRTLSDIGLRRDDVNWANSLPLEKNAAMELDKISQKNKVKLCCR